MFPGKHGKINHQTLACSAPSMLSMGALQANPPPSQDAQPPMPLGPQLQKLGTEFWQPYAGLTLSCR